MDPISNSTVSQGFSKLSGKLSGAAEKVANFGSDLVQKGEESIQSGIDKGIDAMKGICNSFDNKGELSSSALRKIGAAALGLGAGVAVSIATGGSIPLTVGAAAAVHGLVGFYSAAINAPNDPIVTNPAVDIALMTGMTTAVGVVAGGVIAAAGALAGPIGAGVATAGISTLYEGLLGPGDHYYNR